MNETIAAELATVEPNLVIACQAQKGVRKVLKKALQKKILLTLAGLPHGVLKMSADIAGLVETSTNLAIIETGKKEIKVQTSQRSSVASEIEEAAQMVRAVFELGGRRDDRLGWVSRAGSRTWRRRSSSWRSPPTSRCSARSPQIKAVHAGLECGIIGEKYPGMDMVSFGPTMREVHSPNEHLYIDTVEKFYAFLLGILKSVK